MISRDELRKGLQKRLIACNSVLAMWEAGSAAFNRADEYSDLDIGLLVRSGSIEQAWTAVESALRDLGGFRIRWENPLHIFKHMTQRVYRPARAPRWLDLDIGIFEESANDLYLQPQRHGKATILFDRSEPRRTQQSHFDDTSHRQRMREALHQEIIRRNLYRDFVIKEIARGRTIDAFGFYLAFALRPVLTVLGMLHRPDRFDFGFRYVKDELPADVANRIERLCYVATPLMLETRLDEAGQLFEEAVSELARRGITPIDAKQVDV